MIYTVLAIYADNLQRYATAVYAEGPAEAAEAAVATVREDNRDPKADLYVCGVFPGNHECLDVYESLACRTPRRIPDGGDRIQAFTVVGMTRFGNPFTKHVVTSSAMRAEAACITPVRLIAGVLPGKLDNVLPEVPMPGVSISDGDIKSAMV